MEKIRKTLVRISIILDGELILLRNNQNWSLPKGELKFNENSYKCIKRILTENLKKDLEHITQDWTVNHDDTIKPWNIIIRTEQDIILDYGICISGDIIDTFDNIKWVKLDDCHKIDIDRDDTKTIKQYIDYINNELETAKIKKLYFNSIS